MTDQELDTLVQRAEGMKAKGSSTTQLKPDTLLALIAEVRRLRSALMPFADQWDRPAARARELAETYPDSPGAYLMCSKDVSRLRLTDFRDASAALADS